MTILSLQNLIRINEIDEIDETGGIVKITEAIIVLINLVELLVVNLQMVEEGVEKDKNILNKNFGKYRHLLVRTMFFYKKKNGKLIPFFIFCIVF